MPPTSSPEQFNCVNISYSLDTSMPDISEVPKRVVTTFLELLNREWVESKASLANWYRPSQKKMFTFCFLFFFSKKWLTLDYVIKFMKLFYTGSAISIYILVMSNG